MKGLEIPGNQIVPIEIAPNRILKNRQYCFRIN